MSSDQLCRKWVIRNNLTRRQHTAMTSELRTARMFLRETRATLVLAEMLTGMFEFYTRVQCGLHWYC